MTNENLQQLAEIYNNLLRIHTCGEDSFLMTDCMRALYHIINDEAKLAQSKETQEE
jgi:hypothetical protein